ncbi:DUF2934 domain-containing protein [Halochromatium roseum]|uniref:DUF2934 domain-containing protein n=1 Tax=Halochromatium roseum TaxID=391920 RepID=UPI0019148213|nr:DUF2934 domain-containing protein [Halochromatium roseum]
MNDQASTTPHKRGHSKGKQAQPSPDIMEENMSDPKGDCPRDEAISEMAYYLAEARGFEPGHEIEDWLEAEKRVSSSAASPENRVAVTS